MQFVVTTTQSMEEREPVLDMFLQESQFRFVARQRKSLEKLMQENQVDGIIVWEKQGPVLYIENEKFFFHPSMAKNRIAFNRHDDTPDLMIRACRLEAGDSFLDCTLGLGADSIVAAYFSRTGRITGLEHQPEIAFVIRWGMKLYSSPMPWLEEAINRIEVLNQDYRAYLSKQEDNSYDIVYFDPMFQKPILKSQAISPLRKLADHNPLQPESVKEACRVARRRVVMKELAAGNELERLGFTKFAGSDHNRIAYGFIDV